MPEGPEIRQVADRLASALAGQVIVDAQFLLPAMRGQEREVIGIPVREIQTRGKALLTHFDNGWTIYSHNQLYGRWYLVPRDAYPDTGRSLRLALHTASHSALLYSASEISLWRRSELSRHPFLAGIGPDILDPDLSWRELARRLAQPRFCRRQLAALYLDQAFLAGIGNYLRSEILFDAGANPWQRPQALSRVALNVLARSSLVISRRSYASGGVTNPPRLAAALRRRGLSRGQYRHAVFGRDGQPCYRCGSEVRKASVSSRRLYWCPRCQP